MTPEGYIKLGKKLEGDGHKTDGCTFVGFLLDDKYTPACWAHDFARRGLIKFDSQGDNDNMFRKALRHLGMSKGVSNLMYYFTKTQGWFQDHLNMKLEAFMGFMFFLTVVGLMFYYSTK